MPEQIAILSDIHANLTALEAVLDDMRGRRVGAVILMGDLVNYGPRPNETIERLRQLEWPVLANIWGNHEYSLFGGSPERFSTDRGRAVLEYTRGILADETWDYLRKMNHAGREILTSQYGSFLLVHGTLDDPYWGKFNWTETGDEQYHVYDFVITGHSHVPHYLEEFSACDNPLMRNKKRTVFINPGSVGQPRDHNPQAQYGLLDLTSGTYEHHCVAYDISAEQALYSGVVDVFYKERLEKGI